VNASRRSGKSVETIGRVGSADQLCGYRDFASRSSEAITKAILCKQLYLQPFIRLSWVRLKLEAPMGGNSVFGQPRPPMTHGRAR
jgi:hypothetical protein